MSIKNVTGSFNSFQELAAAAGCKPVKKKANDEKKLKTRRENFAKHHICRACGMPMTYQPETNIMTCTNPDCKGIKFTRIDKDGNELVYYEPSFDILSDKGASIANSIF